jgi:uncharacterized membrane protein YidH (DUF202 family)
MIMKKIQKISAGLAAVLFTPLLALAQFEPSGGAFGDLLQNLLKFTNTVLIPFILGIGFLVFVWGMFKFFIYGGADDEAKTSGKSLMVWATLGFVLIIIFWGVVNLISESTGFDNKNAPSVIPNVTI